jgi:hypothetical protein
LLHPYIDPKYETWRKGFAARREVARKKKDHAAWDETYQGEWFEALIDLLKRSGLLPMGMI